jgi:hypothetical protein
MKSVFNQPTKSFNYSNKPVFDGQEPEPVAKKKEDDPNVYVASIVMTTHTMTTVGVTLYVYIVEGYDNAIRSTNSSPLPRHSSFLP